MTDDNDENGWTVAPEDRAAAHALLDRWLDECPHEAGAAYESGRSGYLGRLKLCAFAWDDGIALRIERSFSEAL